MSKQHSKLKVYVVGGGNDGHYIKNTTHTRLFDEADIVMFRGGADINPDIYAQKPNRHTNWWSDERDAMEMNYFKQALSEKKLIIGNCRGGQLLTALNGGKLIQHVSHPGHHMCTTFEGTEYEMNSMHHQMMYPYNLPPEDYQLVSWTEQLSYCHIGEDDQQIEFPEIALDEKGLFKEPEVIWYPKTRCLGIQGHFEWMSTFCDGNEFINKFIKENCL